MKKSSKGKIILFLIFFVLLMGRIYADSSTKLRVCISDLNVKRDILSQAGDEGAELSFDSAHAFYNVGGELLKVDSAARYLVKSTSSQMAQFYLDSNGVASVKPKGFEGVYLFENGVAKYAISNAVKIDSLGAYFKYNQRKYAQAIYFVRAKSGFIPINYIDVEEYLRGVLPSEMPSKWHIEALKAQAVAARTYAHKSARANDKNVIDILSTTADQMYKGVSAYTPQTDMAVAQTAGKVLTYHNDIITSFYSADNGGYTVGSLKQDYLKAKRDIYSGREKRLNWEYFVSFSQLEEVLGIGGIKSISIKKLDPSLRVLELSIESASGNRTISGEMLRKAIGYSNVKSTLFVISGNPNSDVDVFHGLTEQKQIPIAPLQEHGQINATSTKQYYVISDVELSLKPLEGMSVIGINGGSESKLLGTQIFVQNIVEIAKLDLSDLTANGIAKNKGSNPITEIPIMDMSKFLASRGDTPVYKERGGIYVKGSGYGHGLGLSQWGAKNRAEAGQNYLEILNFYYEGAIIEDKRFLL